MNKFQQAIADTYMGGEFKHLESPEDAGDTLYLFLIRELGEPDMDAETAEQRLITAMQDLDHALQAIQAL